MSLRNYSRVISLQRESQCDLLAGPQGMHYLFMELNIINNVHLEMAMATGMVAPFLSSKESLKVSVGRCN